MISPTRILLGVLLALGVATSAVASFESAEEIEACARANLPELSSVQTVTLTAVDRHGSQQVSRAKIYWQKFPDGYWRLLLRLLAPANLRNTALLLIERKSRSDIFMYLPELRKVRRMTKHTLAGPLLGTDFSYEDFERLQGLAKNSGRARLPDSVIDGRPVYVLEVRPSREEGSAYHRIVSYVDRETCVPLRAELFAKGERLRKVLTVPTARITREKSGWVARTILVEDLVDHTRSELRVEEIELEPVLPRKLFSQRELEARGH